MVNMLIISFFFFGDSNAFEVSSAAIVAFVDRHALMMTPPFAQVHELCFVC